MESLLALPVFCFDFQTTDTRPQRGHVVEIGWSGGPAAAPEPVTTRLVRLPEGERVPGRVSELTGITEALLADASPLAEIWESLVDEAKRFPIAVAHYARFEQGFISVIEGVTGSAFPAEILCTQKMARRLLPRLPAWGIRAVAGHLGNSLPEVKRAELHVEATRYIWRRLCERLDAEGVTTLEGLREWIARPVETAPRARRKPLYLVERDERLKLSRVPGIYRMYAADGRLLYIGKATSLKDRVNSYFRSKSVKRELLAQVARVETVEVATPLEAALLENDEIKRWNPPYNISLRDRARRLEFLSRDLREITSAPDESHPHGPFRARRVWLELEALAHLDEEACREEVFPGLESEEVLDDGLRGVLDRAADLQPTVLAGMGRRYWHIDCSDAETESEREEDGEAQWTAERVTLKVRRVLSRAASALLRARWCCRLTEATLCWEVREGERRFLRIEGGEIVERGFLGPADPLPVPPEWRRPILARQRVLDPVTFDRMNVLMSGIRGLTKNSGDVRLRLSPTRELTARRLQRWLL